MGFVYAEFKLTNLFTGVSVSISPLVDTGASHLFVTEVTARALGFDPDEMPTRYVVLADGRRVIAPIIAPIRIEFENRTYSSAAMVLGNESMMGVVPLEAMDLVVDPGRTRVICNPDHPPEGLWRA